MEEQSNNQVKKRILITYATKTNTTKEISEKIGTVLEENGIEVDIKPIDEVKDLSQYVGAVIGAPINGMRWLPEAVQFVEMHQKSLTNMTTAVFYDAYYHGMKRQFWQNMMKKSINSIKELIHASDVGMFAGRIEGVPPGFLRLMFGAPKGLPSDRRDWQAITEWANRVARIL